MHEPTLFTIGHSARPLADFLDLLHEAGVEQLVDVRSVPRSRHNPQFEGEALAQSLPSAGVASRHAPGLGRFRRARRDSPNTGWEHASSRGYADYMATAEFGTALEQLQRDGCERPTCVMCAEAQWWRCHRRLIADAIVVADGEWRISASSPHPSASTTHGRGRAATRTLVPSASNRPSTEK